jgi:hypothetical protein
MNYQNPIRRIRMQRKIKFRFWHTEYKIMLNWDDVQDNSLQFLFAYGTLERMQYTGLKDKNGKKFLRAISWNFMTSTGR